MICCPCHLPTLHPRRPQVLTCSPGLFCPDYGYKCHYDREIKRRGRLPTSMAASAKSNSNKSTPQQGVRSVPNGSSPASSVPSPNHMALQASQFSLATPPLRRGSMGRPAPLLGLNLPMAPSHALAAMTAPRSASFATPSCSYHAPHVHLQLSSLLDSSAEQPLLSRTRDSPPELPAASASDTSASYPSPANGVHGQVHTPVVQRSTSFGSNVPAGQARDRSSFSTSTAVTESVPELQQANFLFQAPSSDCRYRCLEPVLPYLRDILPASVACDLLDVYLTEPGSSLFKCASPYILTRVFRKQSLLHPTHPRLLTPALLATMLWTAAQTADIVMLHVPGSRSKITNALYDLATSLISDRDPDRWRRIHGTFCPSESLAGAALDHMLTRSGTGGLCAEKEQPQAFTFSSALPPTTATNEPAGVIDDVLTFILLSIAVSGGDFKTDCFKWWNKATRLAVSLRLNREDEHCSGSLAPCVNPLCSCRKDRGYDSMAEVEAKEERRRVFWLLYCLDRHLALSFNTIIFMPDCYCEIYGKYCHCRTLARCRTLTNEHPSPPARGSVGEP